MTNPTPHSPEAPERIYLIAGDHIDGMEWCQDPDPGTDTRTVAAYVRSDLAGHSPDLEEAWEDFTLEFQSGAGVEHSTWDRLEAAIRSRSVSPDLLREKLNLIVGLADALIDPPHLTPYKPEQLAQKIKSHALAALAQEER